MIGKKNILSYCFILFLLILISLFSYSQENKDTTFFKADFFEIENPIDITLTYNVTKLKRTKDDENYMPGTLEFFTDDSIKLIKNIRVRARGFARKKQCNLPPFLINVNDTSINREFIAGAKKIKIVSDCNSSKTYKEYVLKEFLAYKIFNLITDNSFRVRLVNLKLIDTGRKNMEYTSLMFMIEPEELLAQRLNSMPIKINNLNFHQIEASTTDMMSFFQYMIGNTDFAIIKRHNVKLLLSNDFQDNTPYAVPYDFDYAGIVNTFYAVPDELFGITDVTQRYYRGMCRTDAEFQELIDYYLTKEDEIISLIKSFEYLEEKPKKEVLDYIEQFYLELKAPDFIERIRKSCKQ